MGPDIAWLLDIAKSLGVGAGPIFAVLWWLERSERKEVTKEYLALLPQTITAISETKSTVGTLGEIIRDVRGSLTNLGQSLISVTTSRPRGGHND